jgi:uncharacterized membrane protein
MTVNQINNNQPKNQSLIRTLLGWSLLAVVIMLALSAWAWRQTPADAQIPVHWGITGAVDRYGSKLEGLLLLPLITLGLALLFAALPRLDPRGDNILRSFKAYRAAWGGLMLFMLGLHSLIIASVLGYPINLTQVVLSATGLLFMVLGNYMGKIRRNYVMGIRTPWTLENELVWDKTHRLGGRLFAASGLVTLLAALFASTAVAMGIMLASLLITTGWSVGYSYWLWKQVASEKRVNEVG